MKPCMADLMIILMYVAVAGAIVATGYSLWRASRSREQSWLSNRVVVGVGILVCLILLLSWLFGGSVADMFIWTIIILFIVAILTICLSIANTKYLR